MVGELWHYPFHLLILKYIQVVITVPIWITFVRKDDNFWKDPAEDDHGNTKH